MRGKRIIALFFIGVFAVLGAATSAPEEGEGSHGSGDRAALNDLESHLSRGEAYGEGPGGPEMAAALLPSLNDDIGDALAIRVLPGNPERIVAVLKLPDLADFADSEREAWLGEFGETIRRGFGANDSQIVVGIRGNVFFGAVATMEPGAAQFATQTGSIVSTDDLVSALNEESQPVPAGQIRQDHYGSIAASDPAIGDAPNADRYEIQLPANTTLTATMHAPEIDCYLRLLDASGTVLAENDDGADGLNSQIVYSAAEASALTIVASTYSESDFGSYAVRIRTSPGAATAAGGAGSEVVEQLNEMCPDTHCEGRYNYVFRTFTCEGSTCVLGFSATDQDTDDDTAIEASIAVRGFTSTDDDSWWETISEAILQWEQSRS